MTTQPTGPTFVSWDRATIAWTSDGYVFEVPAFFELRAVAYLEKRLSKQPLADATWELTPSDVVRDDRGARAQDGWIRLVTPRLFELDPRELREFLDVAVEAAVRAGERAEETDRQRAGEFLSELRGERGSV